MYKTISIIQEQSNEKQQYYIVDGFQVTNCDSFVREYSCID